MKKSDINKVLKENGYGFVKIQTGEWAKPEKCYTGWDGKKVKGIRGGSYGPLTVTSAYQEKNESIIKSVTSSLKSLGMVEKDSHLESQDGKIKVALNVEVFPQYTRSAGYDVGYQSCYIIPNFL